MHDPQIERALWIRRVLEYAFNLGNGAWLICSWRVKSNLRKVRLELLVLNRQSGLLPPKGLLDRHIGHHRLRPIPLPDTGHDLPVKCWPGVRILLRRAQAMHL